MERGDCLTLMHKLELAFRPIPAERMAIYVDLLLRKNVTYPQLGDAVLLAIEKCERFPSVAELLRFAQPVVENAPRRDEEAFDLAGSLDQEEASLRWYARQATLKGDYWGANDIQKRIDRIWQQRANRGLTSKMRPAVENFDGTPIAAPARDWAEPDLVSAATGERGYPNVLSVRAGERLEKIIHDRFGTHSWHQSPPREKHAKPAAWAGASGPLESEQRWDDGEDTP